MWSLRTKNRLVLQELCDCLDRMRKTLVSEESILEGLRGGSHRIHARGGALQRSGKEFDFDHAR